ARVHETSLSGAILDAARATGALFNAVDGTGSRLAGAELAHVTFSSCILDGACFVDTRPELTTFYECNAAGADFSRADLVGTIFYQVDLSKACLGGARFERTVLVDSSLAGQSLRG
ncbi:MAG: hypothetical protein CO090_04080, partial [Acidobacteria bacterium CG_4_9_14_3_um_filter_49_7]